MIVDSGPLVALTDRNEPAHVACVEVLRTVVTPLQSTWPVLTEAMYLVGKRYGKHEAWHHQERLWRLVLHGHVCVCELGAAELERCYRLMHKYRDLPMDLADATLVALAESMDIRRVFTLDSDFRVYRLGREQFEIIP